MLQLNHIACAALFAEVILMSLSITPPSRYITSQGLPFEAFDLLNFNNQLNVLHLCRHQCIKCLVQCIQHENWNVFLFLFSLKSCLDFIELKLQVAEDLFTIWDWVLNEKLQIFSTSRSLYSAILVVPETFDSRGICYASFFIIYAFVITFQVKLRSFSVLLLVFGKLL